MCFKAKMSVPKTKAADIVAPEAPLTEAPSGVLFGGQDDDDKGTGSSEVGGISDLKVKTDDSVKKSKASSGTIKTSSTAKSAKRSSFFGR